MTLEQLRIFVAVAERGHLTRAAGALNLSPSAVSSALRLLEGRHGAELFHRVGRHIELSEAGRAFLPAARAALAAAAAAEQALDDAGQLRRGRLRLAASQTVGAYWLPEAMMAFHARYPGISLDVAFGNTASVAAAVIEGSADLGFIEGEIDEPALASRGVATDRLAILVGPGHRWVQLAPKAADLLRARWILREPGSGTRSAFLSALDAGGVAAQQLDIAMELPSNEAILTALRDGRYAGVASERVAEAALAAGMLARVDYALRPRLFRMLWHKERHRSTAALALAAILPQVDQSGVTS